ncbi:MAG: succinyl-diaminopimelate desuccinylase [Acidimicrobiales bacterium]
MKLPDLLGLTAQLVDIASESFHEGPITDWLEAQLRAVPGLTVDRVGDNLVARTNLGRKYRVLLGGHTDTVPANDNATARVDGPTLWGLGSADMKGGLAVMLELARSVAEPAVDVTYLFYAREEVGLKDNGLRELFDERPDLCEADVGILGEPTSAVLEAGCQGTMRLTVSLAGKRAHSARAWVGRNAIHRAGPLLSALEAYEPRQPTIDGCTFHEGMQAVFVDGGVAGNVVPDSVKLIINHRFAPDRTIAEAEAHVREVLAPFLEDGDTIELTDAAASAKPGMSHPLLAALAGRNDLEVRAKLGWTDVAFFAERGLPAVNFGAGDPLLAHTQQERVEEPYLQIVFIALADLLINGV